MKYETTWWVALHGQAIRIFVRPSLAEAEAFIASEYGASWAARGFEFGEMDGSEQQDTVDWQS